MPAFPKFKTSAEVSRKYYVLTNLSTRTYSNDLTKMPKRSYTHLNDSLFKYFEKVLSLSLYKEGGDYAKN